MQGNGGTEMEQEPQKGKIIPTYSKFDKKDGFFFIYIAFLVVCSYVISYFPKLTPWFGFAIAGYSVIANDSIQTLGTFISSQKRLAWYWLWLYAAGILVCCLVYGWWTHSGDIAFGRLRSIPEPERVTFTLLLAPIVLLVLTHFKTPVSTTFLLLSSVTHSTVIRQIIIKSLLGYLVSFVVALVLWFSLYKLLRRWQGSVYRFWFWEIAQFFTTAGLWSIWIMHDMANVTVFLPRIFPVEMLVGVVSYLALILGLLFYWQGGDIQVIVQDKSNTQDVRAATLIDAVYGVILYIFKEISHVPMSTTWVFLGLLAGRELAINLAKVDKTDYKKIIGYDISKAGLGLLISFVVANLV